MVGHMLVLGDHHIHSMNFNSVGLRSIFGVRFSSGAGWGVHSGVCFGVDLRVRPVSVWGCWCQVRSWRMHQFRSWLRRGCRSQCRYQLGCWYGSWCWHHVWHPFVCWPGSQFWASVQVSWCCTRQKIWALL